MENKTKIELDISDLSYIDIKIIQAIREALYENQQTLLRQMADALIAKANYLDKIDNINK